MSHREAAWLLIFALLVRLAFFHGFVGADDAAYVTEARRLLEGERSWELHPHNQRHGMILPTAVLLWAGHGSFAVLSLFPLLASLIAVLLTRDLGERLTGDAWIGRVGAIFLAVLPIDVVFATQLFPDLPASTGVAASFWIVVRRRSPRSALVAGLVMGWALLCKESMVVFLPFLGGWIGLHRRRALLPWLAGVAVPLGIDVVVAAAVTGNPWFHLDAVRRGSHAAVHYVPLSSWWDVPARTFVRFPRLLLDPRDPSIMQYGLLGYVTLVGLVVGIRSRRRAPALWLLSGYLVYVLWPASLIPYVPAVPVQQRTLALLSVPLCLVAAQGGVALARRLGFRLAGVVGSIVILSGFAGSAFYGLQYRGAADNAAAFVSWWEDTRRDETLVDAGSVVFTDSTNTMNLPFLAGYRPVPIVRAFPADRRELPAGSLVFIDSKRIGFSGDENPRVLPDYVLDPPANWTELRRFEARSRHETLARLLTPWVPAAKADRLLRREGAVVYLVNAEGDGEPPGVPESARTEDSDPATHGTLVPEVPGGQPR